ncbi:MAG: 2-amino-4-hydroxy-6-hydroxymethyldihydropteridine diphosphokinase [Bacteroidales bacterium]|nr:2-amino-4-hydroxy-6-hydroxymethyldihydropteridine diphosphokinase [Bacteroidales bacterium]MBQ4476798.1 2-amino-4-hydroxy-6-hydroxymethyldihydropteridine diphosphokinase [Bacteroidales bacterium]
MESKFATTAPNKENIVFLGIGGNLGDRLANLRSAVNLIGDRIGKIEKVSSVYMSEPWGFKHAKYFTNVVAKVHTSLSADETLTSALQIEAELKRTRSGNGYEGRTMDIDILFFNNEILNTERLVVPHPHICQRKFVLLPMAEITTDFVHPQNGKTMQQLAEICPDNGRIRKLSSM